MRKILYLLFLPVIALSQKTDTLSLETCQKNAIANYPLIKQKNLLSNASEIKLKNISKSFLPQLNIGGQLSYQSDVTEIPIHIHGIEIPSLYKDMYKLTFDVTETIYDGGFSESQKKFENISLQLDLQNNESELYKIKEKINIIFFGIISMQDNKNLLKLLKDDITNKLTKIKSGVNNGVLTESNAYILQAEIIKIEEELIETESEIKAAFKMLGDYMNMDVQEGTILKLPEISVNSADYKNARPEIKAFELLQQKTDVSKKLLNSKLIPKAAGFAQLGYGRPGLNMLSNTFDYYYMIGAKLTWNIWDWNQNNNEKNILDIQSQIINTQKETFDLGIKILLEKNISDIEKYEELIIKDNEIILLKEKVLKAAESELENGIITATEYLTELIALSQIKMNLEIHKIQLIKTKVDYLTAKGNF